MLPFRGGGLDRGGLDRGGLDRGGVDMRDRERGGSRERDRDRFPYSPPKNYWSQLGNLHPLLPPSSPPTHSVNTSPPYTALSQYTAPLQYTMSICLINTSD